MGSQLGDLKKLVGDIRSRIDSLCQEKCKELNLDEKVFFKKDDEVEDGDGTVEDDVVDIDSEKESEKESEKNVEESSKSASGVSSSLEPRVSVTTDDSDDGDDDDDEKLAKALEEFKKRHKSLMNDEKDGDNDSDDIDMRTDDKLTYSYKYADNTVDPNLVPKLNFGKSDDDGDDGAVKGALKKFGLKQLAKYALKRGYNSLLKKGLVKGGTKALDKSIAKSVIKSGSKSAVKKIPFGIGLIPAAAFAADRVMDGDISGAGLELASGTTAAVPWIGTLGSLGIDAYLADRDVKRATGKGLVGHGVDAVSKLAGDYIKDKIGRVSTGESFERYNTLYDRAKTIFETESGINESVDGFCFDDYVMESNINNLAVSDKKFNESEIFFGYGLICENFENYDEELTRLFEKISPDGKVSIEDLVEKDTDTSDEISIKRRIKYLLGKNISDYNKNGTSSTNLNAKEYKKAFDMSMGQSGEPTNLQLWHKGLDDLGNGVSKGLERSMLIPQELSRKLNIPKNLGRLAGAGVGGLMFGPVGALAGTALANWLANNHEKYKAKQYANLHNLDADKVDVKRDGYIGSLAGAGIGSLFGGPVGGVIGAGIGHMFDRKKDSKVKTDKDVDKNNKD